MPWLLSKVYKGPAVVSLLLCNGSLQASCVQVWAGHCPNRSCALPAKAELRPGAFMVPPGSRTSVDGRRQIKACSMLGGPDSQTRSLQHAAVRTTGRIAASTSTGAIVVARLAALAASLTPALPRDKLKQGSRHATAAAVLSRTVYSHKLPVSSP